MLIGNLDVRVAVSIQGRWGRWVHYLGDQGMALDTYEINEVLTEGHQDLPDTLRIYGADSDLPGYAPPRVDLVILVEDDEEFDGYDHDGTPVRVEDAGCFDTLWGEDGFSIVDENGRVVFTPQEVATVLRTRPAAA